MLRRKHEKVPGDKINLCIRNELRDTQYATAQQQQDNNSNNNKHNGHRLSFAENGQLRLALQLGETFGYSHILQHDVGMGPRSGMPRGRVCLHFFLKHPLRINGRAGAAGCGVRGAGFTIEQGVLCLVLFMQNYVSIKRNTHCNCQKLHSQRRPFCAAAPLSPLAKGLMAHSCDAL